MTSQPSSQVGTGRKRLPLALLILIAGFVIAAIGLFANSSAKSEVDLLDNSTPIAYGPANYADALKNIDMRIELANERLERAPDQWAYQEGLAINSLIRAQLTGSANDFETASAAIAKAMELAPKSAGPAMTSAIINLSLHRYPDAQSDLEIVSNIPVPATEAELAEIKAGKGDIAFYSGDYVGAYALYNESAKLDGGPRSLFRLATWYKYHGDFDRAISLYETGVSAKKKRTPQMFATYLLQIGALELQRGEWDKAHRYFDRANAVFPGYWLTQAHVAQMLAVKGETKKAERIYLDIIGQSENPDVMMALSSLYEHIGTPSKSMMWKERAGQIMERRLKALPEAYYDHGLDHALSVGDSKKALALASKNYQARPYGDAGIALARAHLANGDANKAVVILKQVNGSGWVSVEQHLALADAYKKLGKTDLAKGQEQIALKLNPKALHPNAGLLSFGNH